MYIGKNKISLNDTPFIIAEMSGNHNHSLDRALKLVDEASAAGAHAIKIQTYTADTITIKHDKKEFYITDDNNIWKGQSLYELYEKAHTPWEWHKDIFKRAADKGIVCFSSPFDETAVDFLEGLDTPAYKIASFENIHLPLIKKVANTGKPVIVSTGMATISEIDEVVQTILSTGNENFILLKCTSTYPASPLDSNILTIPHLRNLYKCEVGLSDHTLGIGAAIAAVAHGGTVIEKHFTLDRNDGGVDSSFSLDPSELRLLVKETKQAWQSLGKINYGFTDLEKDFLKHRRSIYVSKDIKKGERLTEKNIRIIRPGLGLPPKYYSILLGRKARENLKKGRALSWEIVD